MNGVERDIEAHQWGTNLKRRTRWGLTCKRQPWPNLEKNVGVGPHIRVGKMHVGTLKREGRNNSRRRYAVGAPEAAGELECNITPGSWMLNALQGNVAEWTQSILSQSFELRRYVMRVAAITLELRPGHRDSAGLKGARWFSLVNRQRNLEFRGDI